MNTPTVTLKFIGGSHDGEVISYTSSPPPFIMWVDDYYIFKKWQGEPDYIATYEVKQREFGKLPWKPELEQAK